MADGLRLVCWCLLFAFVFISSATSTFSLSGTRDEVMKVSMPQQQEGRSLKMNLNDYSEASANRGHDPRNKLGSRGGRRSGGKN